MLLIFYILGEGQVVRTMFGVFQEHILAAHSISIKYLYKIKILYTITHALILLNDNSY